MMRAIVLLFALAACKEEPTGADASDPDLGPKDSAIDAGSDTGSDAGADAEVDSGVDTGVDGGAIDADTEGPGVVFRLFDRAGTPLENATIEVAGGSFTTGTDGTAFLPDVSGDRMFVVERSGFLRTPFGYSIPAGARVQIDATLHSAPGLSTLSDSMFSMFSGERALALIGADALETETGTDITGSYQARLVRIDTSVASDVVGAPLPFIGTDDQGNDRLLEIFAVLEMEVTQDGAPLFVKSGASIEIDVVIPDAIAGDVAMGEIVPAWSYDEATGRWIEEFDGTVNLSAFGELTWVATSFTHFSWWAIARPFDGACLQARATDSTNAPIAAAMIRAIGVDHGFVGASFTDAFGDTCIEIKPSGNVAVSAIHESYASLASPVSAMGNLTPGSCGGGGCAQAPLALEAPSCAEGIVLDGVGAPYANAAIRVATQNSSGQNVSQYTATDASGAYCAEGPTDGAGTVIATDGNLTASSNIRFGAEPSMCSQTCTTAPDLILADFVGGCVHGTAEIYQGMDNPLLQAPEGTPIYVYAGSGGFTASCAAGQDDPAMWGELEAVGMVGAQGLFCITRLPLGPTTLILGDCTTWPSEVCGPNAGGGSVDTPAVCGQPACVDVGAIRYNTVCDGGGT
jgi:hypothetical protein